MDDHSDDPKPVRRVEVITGMGRRRRWSDEEKARIVTESFAPGAVVAEVARRHDARAQQVHGWRRDAREGRLVLPAEERPNESASFVPVVIAPPEQHLVVRGERLALTTDPERHSCRPAVDVLFESLARELGPRCLAALLTGMGRDGAAGLASIRSAGGRTIAQDEASSVVFSMPREAIRLGGAEQILALSAIAPALSSLARDALGRDA